ncbi:MAG TPA: hypothetical protein VNI54_03385, partial [Thermoanaerobaculia bacterium]|nr:hypothetical protein [Thermoanaerobaculia bacterium]
MLQVNSFFFRGATSHELVGEWAMRSPRHQLAFPDSGGVLVYVALTVPSPLSPHAGRGDWGR